MLTSGFSLRDPFSDIGPTSQGLLTKSLDLCMLQAGSGWWVVMGFRQWNRREFITLLGGATASWSFSARAQQPERMRRIGVLLPATSDDPEFQARVGAFMQGLQQLGWSIGRNLRIDTRWATTNAAEIRRHAADLAALAPDVILAHGASTVGPLLQATRTVPVVFPVIGDPVGAGYVSSLARPGGNATGFMPTNTA